MMSRVMRHSPHMAIASNHVHLRDPDPPPHGRSLPPPLFSPARQPLSIDVPLLACLSFGSSPSLSPFTHFHLALSPSRPSAHQRSKRATTPSICKLPRNP